VSDFDDYAKAKPELISRLGSYCSYCERRIETNLAVEHILPKKGPNAHPQLIGRWENFLLACVNCNATKGDKSVVLAEAMLPDRDNTFVVYTYTEDGKVSVAPGLVGPMAAAASATLSLVGLNKRMSSVTDSNGLLVARDRVEQRQQAWLTAQACKDDLDLYPTNQVVRRMVVRNATATGFFSIWMTVFAHDVDLRNQLLDAFDGTRGSQCFAPVSSAPVSPAPNPNPDGLAGGGKA